MQKNWGQKNLLCQSAKTDVLLSSLSQGKASFLFSEALIYICLLIAWNVNGNNDWSNYHRQLYLCLRYLFQQHRTLGKVSGVGPTGRILIVAAFG